MRFDPPAGTDASRKATRAYHKAWKALKHKEHPVIYRNDSPELWQDWRAYYAWKNIDLPLAIMDEPTREYHTVPTLSPVEFDPSFDPDKHNPPKWRDR